MKVDLKERTAVAPSVPGVEDPKRAEGPRVFIAILLVVAMLAIGTFEVLHEGASSPGSRAVYLDPMTGLRERGLYAQPAVASYVSGMTGSREAGPYATSPEGTSVNPMTGLRERVLYVVPEMHHRRKFGSGR